MARLSKIHLITSVDELKDTLSEIDEQSISASKKAQKKRVIKRANKCSEKSVSREH